jgi:short-subunit dehydrogenase
MSSPDEVRRTVAVVTGGARGIGFAIGSRLAARGDRVLLTDLDESLVRQAAQRIGTDCAWMVQDVRNLESHERVAAKANELGRLATWVNNAGVLIAGDGWTNQVQDIAKSFDVNVVGLIAGSNAAVRAMPGGGSILNIASNAALGPVPGLAVYAATKAAVLSYTTSLQGDLDHAGLPIRVHALCPDVVATDMVTSRSSDSDAAILFAGERQLTADQVAAVAVKLLGGRAVVRSVPRLSGLMTRAVDLAPGVGLRAAVLARKAGERRQQRTVTP